MAWYIKQDAKGGRFHFSDNAFSMLPEKIKAQFVKEGQEIKYPAGKPIVKAVMEIGKVDPNEKSEVEKLKEEIELLKSQLKKPESDPTGEMIVNKEAVQSLKDKPKNKKK
jgi:hypothetical protein